MLLFAHGVKNIKNNMSEKQISADHIFGSDNILPEIEKRAVQTVLKEAFDGKLFQELLPKERNKTQDEIRAVERANTITNELTERYGGKQLTIPSNNIHVAPHDQWDSRLPHAAYYAPLLQAVIMKEQVSMSSFIRYVIHEMIHFKSWASFRVSEKDETFFPYRVGIEATRVIKPPLSTKKTIKRIFAVLNEAMTEELAKRLFHQHNLRALFPEEEKETASLFANDGTNDEIVAGSIQQQDNGNVHRQWIEFGYKPERNVLNTMIDLLYARNQDTFENREEVFDLFARWMFSRSSNSIGKLIDKTFGTGTFKRLAGVPLYDPQAQQEFLNSLT
jgi:hypothetical protein